MRGKRTSLRAATAHDVERLCAWHADSDVARYWDDETFTHDEMRERLARAVVDAWIVEAGGEPVGYLQTHPAGAAVGGFGADACSEGLDLLLVPAARVDPYE